MGKIYTFENKKEELAEIQCKVADKACNFPLGSLRRQTLFLWKVKWK
jgi:hypothetical protein